MYSEKLKRRFFQKVKTTHPDLCWEWIGSRTVNGYGRFRLERKKVNVFSHRLSLAIHENIEIPPSKIFCCHMCDNPSCVNPKHLYWGDAFSNSQDMIARGRRGKRNQTGSLNGSSKLSEDDVVNIKSLIAIGLNNKKIASRYGVTHSSISLIRRGKTWRHL